MIMLDDTTKAVFFGGIAFGSVLGLFSNYIISEYFRVYKTNDNEAKVHFSDSEKVIFWICVIGYFALFIMSFCAAWIYS